MKILLFGSIAAGKTTLAKEILKHHSDFCTIAIDDYRKKFGDFTMSGEIKAQKQFISAVKKNKNQIIEASGLGKLGTEMYEKVIKFDENIFVIILYISIDEINKRLETRIWDIPFPGKQDKLEEIIYSINFGVQFGKIPIMWSEAPKTTVFQIENKNKNTRNFIIKTIDNYIKLNTL